LKTWIHDFALKGGNDTAFAYEASMKFLIFTSENEKYVLELRG
jgi:hypothetical protein